MASKKRSRKKKSSARKRAPRARAAPERKAAAPAVRPPSWMSGKEKASDDEPLEPDRRGEGADRREADARAAASLPAAPRPATKEETPSVSVPTHPPPPPTSASLRPERLRAELDELSRILTGFSALSYLEPRVARWREEGIDAASLLSVYRLTSNAMKEELERLKRTLEELRRNYDKLRRDHRARLLKPPLPETAGETTPPQPEKPTPSPASPPSPPPPAFEPAVVNRLRHEMRRREKMLVEAERGREKVLEDLRNLRRRMDREVEQRAARAKEELVSRLLPILDSFSRAEASIEQSENNAPVVEGFRMILHQFQEALRGLGLSEINPLGEPFDPNWHEAMDEVVTDHVPDGAVAEVLFVGYGLDGKLLRPARVRVARSPAQKS